MGFLHDGLARERVKHSLYSTINRTYAVDAGPERNFRVTWDNLQKTVSIVYIRGSILRNFKLHCCGVETYQDWFYASRWKSNRFVPDSCCDPKHFAANASMKNCGKIDSNEHMFFKQVFRQLLEC